MTVSHSYMKNNIEIHLIQNKFSHIQNLYIVGNSDVIHLLKAYIFFNSFQ